MKRRLLIGVILAGNIGVGAVLAGIPRPDAVLFGQVFIAHLLQHPEDAITIVGRVDGVPNPVAECRLGDNPAAGDFYVLRIRLESLADGSSHSSNAALVGQTVHVYVKKGDGGEQLYADYLIPGQAHIEYRDLGARIRGDWNGDAMVGLEDFGHFGECMAGPAAEPGGQCLAVFDFDGNSRVDLTDHGYFQMAFAAK